MPEAVATMAGSREGVAASLWWGGVKGMAAPWCGDLPVSVPFIPKSCRLRRFGRGRLEESRSGTAAVGGAGNGAGIELSSEHVFSVSGNTDVGRYIYVCVF